MATDNSGSAATPPHDGRMDRKLIIQQLQHAPKVFGLGNSTVAQVSDTLVVKYGEHTHLWEARNMEFAASIPWVRVPRVHDAWEEVDSTYEDEPLTTTYIVMDFIPGSLLTNVWGDLPLWTRQDIYRQLREMIEALHQQPMRCPGPKGGGKSNSSYFSLDGAGPFDTSKDMESWFNGRLSVCKRLHRALQEAPDFSGLFDSLVMCHLDLHTRNIILDAQEQVWLLDWDNAGGYPVFFEEANLRHVGPDPSHPDFTKKLIEMISSAEYEEEIRRLDSIEFAISTGINLEP